MLLKGILDPALEIAKLDKKVRAGGRLGAGCMPEPNDLVPTSFRTPSHESARRARQ